MVKRLEIPALFLLGGLLAGCPDDVGKDLHEGVTGLVAPRSFQGWANGGLEVDLAWEDAATTEQAYRLEISMGPFAFGQPIDFLILPANATSFAYSCLPAHAYYFRLFAITDTKESDPSEEIVVYTPAVLPGTPSILSLTGDWSGIIVQWTDVSGETGYQIEVSEDGGPWTPVPLSIPADVQAAAFLPTPGVSDYWVRIYAIGPYGISPRSDAWTIKIPPKGP
jgi:hypothetical protein